MHACEKTNAGDKHDDAEDTVWMAVVRERAAIDVLTGNLGWWQRGAESYEDVRPWTDQYCNIIGAMFK
jgi:hypothetical protein